MAAPRSHPSLVVMVRKSVPLLVVPLDQVPQVFLSSAQAGDLGVSHEHVEPHPTFFGHRVGFRAAFVP